MHGEPPTLPEDYSPDAHAFVRACLDKNPNSRPTYNMLLRHPWLSSLMQPPEQSGDQSFVPSPHSSTSSMTEDPEVAEWVKTCLERRENGLLGESNKPALHAVPLDAVPGSPMLEDTDAMRQ